MKGYMMSDNSMIYQEQYSHETDGIPYSLHCTNIPKKVELALYLHWHHEVEFFYVDRGTLLFSIEDEILRLSAGDALFIPSHLLHQATVPDGNGCHYYACVFSTELLTHSLHFSEGTDYVNPFYFAGMRNYIAIQPHLSWYSIAIMQIQTLMNYYHNTTAHDGILVIGTLMHLWHTLYTHHFSQLDLPEHRRSTVSHIKKSLHYIHHHYEESITLVQLAQVSALSPGYYCKLFKELYGLTPFDYLNRYRVRQACEKLTNSHLSTLDILYACGFNNASYFNRQFRKYTGMTPRQYRNRC